MPENTSYIRRETNHPQFSRAPPIATSSTLDSISRLFLMILCSVLFTLMLAVNGDAGPVPRAPIQTPELGLTRRKRKSKTNNIASTVNNLSKSGMNRKTLIILLSVILGIIIICCVASAVLLYKRRKDADEEKEERRQQRRQKQKREKAKKKQDAKRQAEPRPSEDDDEERTLVNSVRPSMQVDPFPPPYGSSPHPQEESQFSSHSNRASYSSNRRVEAVREEAAPFLNNAGTQHSA